MVNVAGFAYFAVVGYRAFENTLAVRFLKEKKCTPSSPSM